jgi:hypothetical protein
LVGGSVVGRDRVDKVALGKHPVQRCRAGSCRQSRTSGPRQASRTDPPRCKRYYRDIRRRLRYRSGWMDYRWHISFPQGISCLRVRNPAYIGCLSYLFRENYCFVGWSNPFRRQLTTLYDGQYYQPIDYRPHRRLVRLMPPLRPWLSWPPCLEIVFPRSSLSPTAGSFPGVRERIPTAMAQAPRSEH